MYNTQCQIWPLQHKTIKSLQITYYKINSSKKDRHLIYKKRYNVFPQKLSLFCSVHLAELACVTGYRRGRICGLTPSRPIDDVWPRGDRRGQLLHRPQRQRRPLDGPRELWAHPPGYRKSSVCGGGWDLPLGFPRVASTLHV